MGNVLVLNGPNLNLLGSREPELYGKTSLDAINTRLTELAKPLGLSLKFLQSNAEHMLVDRIQAAKDDQTDFIIINPAAFGHTSIAIRDAFLAVAIPFIEVHLTNILGRDNFRQHSYLFDIARGVICGFGAQGYEFALQAVHRYLTKP